MIWFIIYGIVVVALVYPASKWLMSKMADDIDDPDPEDMFFGIFFGSLLSLMWPVFLTMYLLYRLSKYVWSKVKIGEEDESGRNRTVRNGSDP